MTVGVDDVTPWTETVEGQIPLIDLSRYEARRGFTDWELENENAIETLTPEKSENSIAIGPERDELEDEIDAIKIDVRSLPTYQLITLYEVIARELHYRDESECSLSNLDPNLDPNSVPNLDPNLDPNLIDPNLIDPNLDPNSVPNLDPNLDPNLIDPNLDPNLIDPNLIDPNLIDPNLIDPNSHPIDGYEEIKTIKGRQYRYWRWYENDKKRSKYLGRCENDKKSCQNRS
ncbi:MAG: hypothetical protein GPJ07_19030 [Microcystis aeruginosa G13-07]|nr:hypothetical protein [Microcystis aeruginosa G13-07]